MMLNRLRKLFNHDKLEEAATLLSAYRDRVKALEEEVREYKGYKLKYEVTRLHVENSGELALLMDSVRQQHAAYYEKHGHWGASGRGDPEIERRYTNLLLRIGGNSLLEKQ